MGNMDNVAVATSSTQSRGSLELGNLSYHDHHPHHRRQRFNDRSLGGGGSSHSRGSLHSRGGSLHSRSSLRRPSIRRHHTVHQDPSAIRRRHSGDQFQALKKQTQKLKTSKKGYRSWSSLNYDYGKAKDETDNDTLSISLDDDDDSFAQDSSESSSESSDEEVEEWSEDLDNRSIDLEDLVVQVPTMPRNRHNNQREADEKIESECTRLLVSDRWNASSSSTNKLKFKDATTVKMENQISPYYYVAPSPTPKTTTTRQRKKSNDGQVGPIINSSGFCPVSQSTRTTDFEDSNNYEEDDLEHGQMKKDRWKSSSSSTRRTNHHENRSDNSTTIDRCQELLNPVDLVCINSKHKTALATTSTSSTAPEKYQHHRRWCWMLLLLTLVALAVGGVAFVKIVMVTNGVTVVDEEQTNGL